MSLVLELGIDDLDTFFAYTLIRVYDCLIFHHGHFNEMSRLDKKRYRNLANQELGIMLWAYGIFMVRFPHNADFQQAYGDCVRSLVELGGIRAWTKNRLINAIPVEERPDQQNPFDGPLPPSGYQYAWWRVPEASDVSVSPTLIYTAWLAWLNSSTE
ncbi:hypothetical protein BKA70DRAFT_1421826 [Coprinopsis sp. MPI-PUGE-AT-0042]|nr:hypothetical protein BKA70DRAFT_1421826 [Coprinopsis sp. MPI-PUGE-AT-0042]